MKHYDIGLILRKAQELIEKYKSDILQEDIAKDVQDYIVEEINKGSNTENEKVELCALLIDTVAYSRKKYDSIIGGPGGIDGSPEHAKSEGMPQYSTFADQMLYNLDNGKSEFIKDNSIFCKSTALLSSRLWRNYRDSFSPENSMIRGLYGFLFASFQLMATSFVLNYTGVNDKMLEYSAVALGAGAWLGGFVSLFPEVYWLLTIPFQPIFSISYHQYPPAMIIRALFACSSALSVAIALTSGQSLTPMHALALLPTIINLAQSTKEHIDYYKQANEIKGLIKGVEEERQKT